MKFVEGSPLSDDELAVLSQTMVDAYGESARDIVNRFIDETNANGDFVEHSIWINVAPGVLQILRPNRRGLRQ